MLPNITGRTALALDVNAKYHVITNATYNLDPVPAKFKHVTNTETCTLLCCDYSTLCCPIGPITGRTALAVRPDVVNAKYHVITNATYNRDPVPAKFKHVTNIDTCTLLCCDYSTLWEALHVNMVEIGARCSDKNVKILGRYQWIGSVLDFSKKKLLAHVHVTSKCYLHIIKVTCT